MARAWRQYVVLGFLFICAASYETGNLNYIFSVLRQPKAFPSQPFALTTATRKIGSGPFNRDEILSIDGRPFTAARQYSDAVYRAHPGDKIHLMLSEPSGRAIETD